MDFIGINKRQHTIILVQPEQPGQDQALVDLGRVENNLNQVGQVGPLP